MKARENIMRLMSYEKRVVIDFDDTISIAFDRGWDNAYPNEKVVNKVNELFDTGWEIIILTARGQLSCAGDADAADLKYRAQIEAWLKKHGVKYSELSFNKPLASYYVDDKAMRPQEFIDLSFTDIKTGWSGADIQKRGDRIYKTHPDATSDAIWYSMASSIVNTPKVHSLIGKTICIEFLQSNGRSMQINDIVRIIEDFSLIRDVYLVDFDSYISKMEAHCKEHNKYYYILRLLKKHSNYFHLRQSFMHGDLSIENIVVTNEGLFLIDPLWRKDSFSSFLLDISKLMCSLRFHKRLFIYNLFIEKCMPLLTRDNEIGWGDHLNRLKILEVSHFIRILKYAPDNLKGEIEIHIEDLIGKIIP